MFLSLSFSDFFINILLIFYKILVYLYYPTRIVYIKDYSPQENFSLGKRTGRACSPFPAVCALVETYWEGSGAALSGVSLSSRREGKAFYGSTRAGSILSPSAHSRSGKPGQEAAYRPLDLPLYQTCLTHIGSSSQEL